MVIIFIISSIGKIISINWKRYQYLVKLTFNRSISAIIVWSTIIFLINEESRRSALKYGLNLPEMKYKEKCQTSLVRKMVLRSQRWSFIFALSNKERNSQSLSSYEFYFDFWFLKDNFGYCCRISIYTYDYIFYLITTSVSLFFFPFLIINCKLTLKLTLTVSTVLKTTTDREASF